MVRGSQALLLAVGFGLAACGPRPVAGGDEAGSTAGESDGQTGTELGSEDTTSAGADTTGDTGTDTGGVEDPPAVLFVGNSYTFFNDLPGMVAAIAEASPTPLSVDSLTTAGARVSDHLADPALAPKLEQGFDVVVIQGQSLEPILEYASFEQAVVDFAELVALTGDAELLLFMTWPRAEGSPELAELGMSVDEMWAGLESGYFEASLASGAGIAYVGAAFMSALQLDPPVELYAPDGSHPSLAGSYLGACVFFGRVAERSCATSSWAPAQLDADTVASLQVIADITNGIVNPGP